MYALNSTAESIVESALAILETREDGLFSALDQLPAPIYVTDAQGVVTYFNPACIDFTGRRPIAGQDRWCVTWKLYTDNGEYLPHAACPMAETIQTGRPVRGVSAIAERPDGTRVHFMPYPTPLFAPDGALRGAVNILIDITDRRQSESLFAQAKRCRRLARGIGDSKIAGTLNLLADEYEAQALTLQPKQ